MSRLARLAAGLALLLPATLPLRADPPAPPAPSPYGDTYTPEELTALDRALHAGNMTREDLTFRKDMAKGHACLDIVREMLRDPLTIAPFMDVFATTAARKDPAHGPVSVVLVAANGATGMQRLADAQVLREPWIPGLAPRPEGPKTRAPARTADEALQFLSEVARGRTPGTDKSSLDGWFDVVREPPPTDSHWLRQVAQRRLLPEQILMREVVPSLHPPAVMEQITAYAKANSPSHFYDLCCDGIFSFRFEGMVDLWIELVEPMLAEVRAYPRGVFPTDRPRVLETPQGRLALGTLGDDIYTGDYAVIVDPGGNDRYEHGRFAAAFGAKDREVGLLIDLGGNDIYDCGDVDVTLGAACFGLAGLIDLGQGNDRYVAGHFSLGAAVCGLAVLYDDGGSDTYEGKTFTQGAAGFGVGLLFDDAVGEPPVVRTDEEAKDPIDIARWDNDRLSAWCCAQAFARTMGVALCINTRGNEVYEAGCVYLHAPLFSDRYQSFSQGFSIGAREVDYAGGLAMLIDRAGNDRYLGDIYNQGVGYWYAAGLLYDGGGNDLYEMTQYGQGSGIHLAVGGLVDAGGSDAYVMHSGLGQGGSHDFAASVLHDRGGNDRYDGNTSCNGCGLTNSVGLFFERGGDDTYASKRDGGFNAGRPARGFGSVGVFVDLAGKDDYLGPPAAEGPGDDLLWRGSDVGLGLDVAPAAPAPSAPGTSTPAADQPSGKVEIPAICRYEGPLTQEVFDELWAIAVRWEVGDNRSIVPEARKRLIVFGKEVAPLLDAKMEKDESGLELRAFVDVLGGLWTQAGGEKVVLDLLARNAVPAASERRRKVSLHLIGELKVKELEGAVVGLLKGADETLARRAAGVLALLGSQAGNETLLGWIQPDGDERRILAGLGTLLGTESPVYAQVRPLLDHRLVTVRTRLATLLAEKKVVYGSKVLADLEAEDLSPRALRMLLDAVVRGPVAPTYENHLRYLVAHDDWGVRADVARVLQGWLTMEDRPTGWTFAASFSMSLAGLSRDPDPFVRRLAAPEAPPGGAAR